jgi:hypothetical protein
MTEPTSDLPPELPIQFAGREIFVKMPAPEQLLVWKRSLKQLQAAETGNWNGEQVMATLERSRKIIDAILANPSDVDWLDDEMLAGRVTLMDSAELIQMTVDAFIAAAEAEGNRETRRAAAKKSPAKKAARKKAAATKEDKR